MQTRAYVARDKDGPTLLSRCAIGFAHRCNLDLAPSTHGQLNHMAPCTHTAGGGLKLWMCGAGVQPPDSYISLFYIA